jgi:hypothetical protein
VDEQYPKFVVDSRLARARLAQVFEPGADREAKRRFSPVSDRSLVPFPQKNSAKGDRSTRHLVRSITGFVQKIWTRTLVKPPGAAKRDISSFGFLLLVHLTENAAAHTDNPIFCLLVGPAPLGLF